MRLKYTSLKALLLVAVLVGVSSCATRKSQLRRATELYQHVESDSISPYDDPYYLQLVRDQLQSFTRNNDRERIAEFYDQLDSTGRELLLEIVEQDLADQLRLSSRGQAVAAKNEIRVYFGTNRFFDRNEEQAEAFDNGKYSSKISIGYTDVNIPMNHVLGEIEKPSYFQFEFSNDPTKHMFIKSLTGVDRQQFIEGFSRAGKDQAFVFIHGYNTSFEDAALRTAQIAYDLRYPGVPFFYSWPSQGSLEGYFTDEKNVAKSDRQLYDFLKILVDEGGFEKINIIAHSMGNRVTLNAMMRFRNEEAPVFNHLVMAAPDVDADLFKNEIAPFLQSVSKSNTLYASSNDVALAVSKVVNSKPRAGQAGEDIIVIDPVETIDASAVRADLLGHGYFYNHWRLIQDVYKLVIEDLRAPQRELFENQLQQQKYWSLNDE